MTDQKAPGESMSLSTSDDFADVASDFGSIATCARGEFDAGQTYSLHKLLLKIAEKLLLEERTNIRGERLRFDFGFVEDDAADAFAARRRDRHGFGLNDGLIALSYYLSGELFLVRDHRDQFRLTHPHPHLHAGTVELSLVPPSDPQYESLRHSVEVSYLVDKRRIAISQYFREFLLLFAFFHEYHHVIWGHCEFANTSIGATHLREIGPSDAKIKDNALLHNIEYLADIGAIDLMIWYVNKRSRLNFKWISHISYADLHRVALIACGAMCAAWHEEDQRRGRDGSHPEPGARFGNLLAHYANVFSRSNKEEYFKHKIGKLAIADLTLLSDSCPALRSLVGDTTIRVTNEAHVAEMQDLFGIYRKQTLEFEFRTQKEIEAFGWN